MSTRMYMRKMHVWPGSFDAAGVIHLGRKADPASFSMRLCHCALCVS